MIFKAQASSAKKVGSSSQSTKVFTQQKNIHIAQNYSMTSLELELS
jgi:hypothetical protein